MVVESTILSPGETLGGFQIVNVIGFGGMAVVYRAEQLSLGRLVALKVLAPQLSSDANYQERFRREGRHVAALDHPNIVSVYDSGEAEGRLYLAMRLVEGTTLGERMHEQGLSAEDTVRVLRPIADALDVAHAARLVHRDVKPQNILLAENGHPYLADFGVAKGPQTHELTAAGGFVGSLNYAAPEQILGQPTTAAGDVYALTAVLYQCLTGQVPYPRDTDAGVMHAHLHAPPPMLSGTHAVEAKLNDVIAHGMAKDPTRRYTRAGSLMDAAADVLGELTPTRRHGIPAFPARAPEAGASIPHGGGGSPLRATATGEVASPELRISETELISAQERLDSQRKSEPTTADRRRVPPETPVRPTRTRRNRWPVAVGALVVVAAAAVATMLFASGGRSLQKARDRLLSLTYSSAWKANGSPSPTDARLFKAPIVLTTQGATLSAGQLLSSAAVPGGVPPTLAELLHAPDRQSSTRAGSYAARRYEWATSTGARTVALVLATRSDDLAIVCRGSASAMAACATIADTVKVRGIAIELPGPDTALAKRLSNDLRPASVARRNLAGLGAAQLARRASVAARIARAEGTAASTLAATPVPERNRPVVARVLAALRLEADNWTALAKAADDDQRAQYESATNDLIAASRRLAAAIGAIRVEGLPVAQFGVLALPGLPAIPHPKSVVTVIPVTTSLPPVKKKHVRVGIAPSLNG